MLLLRVVLYISDFKPQADLKIIYFDNKYISHDQKNICNRLLSAYVITVWKTRKENLRIAILKNMIVNKSQEMIEIIKHKSNQTTDNVLGNHLSKIEPRVLLEK